ncbi:chromatin-remodeling complex subunit ies6 [Tilletia horrida]|uniref:Chromatin-remodeling complex subunit ies6 n=1 Tax=Tilletia horrida TaxID=155126 RepID=A0AAN6JN33_9BASI|nr:chromatin-remodeling complex subunit ies6 [Tilletia horrida]
MPRSLKWRPEPEGPPKPSSSTLPAVDTPDAGPTLVEQLSFSSTAKPFKNPAFNRIMSKRNKTLKQIVTTEREAALGLITSGKRKGKRPTALEAAAVVAAGGVAAEAPFEMTIRGPGGRKTRLVGAAARAAQARQLREQKAKEEAEKEGGEEPGGQGDVTVDATADVDADADGEADETKADGADGDAVMEDAQGQAEGSTAAGTEVGAQSPAAAAAAAPIVRPRRDVPSYFSVDAPPSLRPRKHYCDITGLLGPYTDPKTRLRYHNAEIYAVIRRFGPGVDQQYLALRGDAHTIK